MPTPLECFAYDCKPRLQRLGPRDYLDVHMSLLREDGANVLCSLLTLNRRSCGVEVYVVFVPVRVMSHQGLLIVNGNSGASHKRECNAVPLVDAGIGWTRFVFDLYRGDRRPNE